MEIPFLDKPERKRFGEMADILMNGYCIRKTDSRTGECILFRFAETEFYLYDSAEPDMDTRTYCRDCRCAEWFFHYSGVDLAFVTERQGNELTRFGGILIRGVEIYRQDGRGRWTLSGVVGGPRLSMSEIFNNSVGMPDVVCLPADLQVRRDICRTGRIGLKDDKGRADTYPSRFVFADVDWSLKTQRIVRKQKGNNRQVLWEEVSSKYDPKPGSQPDNRQGISQNNSV